MPYFGKDAKMSPTSITYMKNYRKDIFVLPDVGVVTHFSANMTVNSRPGGPNDLFQQLQELENLGLRRYPLAQSFGKCTTSSPHLANLLPAFRGPRALTYNCITVADTLTCHFAVNYVSSPNCIAISSHGANCRLSYIPQGMPYKYVVDVDALPFSAAPDVLLAALGRLTWATQETVPEGEFQKPNELLTLGYFEKMSIGVSYLLPTKLSLTLLTMPLVP
jgi:hypothetical protein